MAPCPVTCAVSKEGEEEGDQAMVKCVSSPAFCVHSCSRASPKSLLSSPHTIREGSILANESPQPSDATLDLGSGPSAFEYQGDGQGAVGARYGEVTAVTLEWTAPGRQLAWFC